jgi:NAD+ synthase (glutamine-hydrolysing)
MKLQLFAHQTHHTIGDFKGIESTLDDLFKLAGKNSLEAHFLPELFLTGYPLQDLCLQKYFIENYGLMINRLNQKLKAMKPAPWTVFLGGLAYEFDELGLPQKIQNVIYQAEPGQGLKNIYQKILLPNYDIYDERKYFIPGDKAVLVDFHGHTLAPMICEDMWVSNQYDTDPLQLLHGLALREKKNIDLIFNLSASPYHLGKLAKRQDRASEIGKQFPGSAFLYVNRVGCEDEILFDGRSFLSLDNKSLPPLKIFEEDLGIWPLQKNSKTVPEKFIASTPANSWETLFSPFLTDERPPRLRSLSEPELQELVLALTFSLQEYASKSGFKKYLVAFSGGIDSALVLALAKLALRPGEELEALFMPGLYSSTLSWDLAQKMCQKLKIKLHVSNIKFVHSTMKNLFRESFSKELEGLANENIQSRLRGLILYTRSNQTGAMVINTSNKSELAVGYSTQYGDSVGALSLIGDLYKCHVFELAHFINRRYGHMIPEEIISRPPTAELRENQTDDQSLPPYPELDAILEGMLSQRLTPQELVAQGHKQEHVAKAYRLVGISEYKRYQFAPITKVMPKSFGFGHRVPLCKTLQPLAF